MAQTSRLVLEIDSRDAEEKATETRRALEALETAGIRVKPAMDKAGAGISDMGDASEKTTKSVKDQRAEVETLLGQLDPLRKKQNELAKSQRELAAAWKADAINDAEYKRFSGIIRDQVTALNSVKAPLNTFNADLGKTGMSAKATAAAMRGVPAQITDIVVSLQGGQAPLTVLLQQGGQLKDMFGGIVPAAKALGSSILGLINPFTIAAASAAALAFAYYQGSKESTAYSTALILSGNAAGTTANQIAVLADRISATTGTTSSAAAVLAQLANSSRIPVEAFEAIATAALAMEKATGKASATTIDEFEKIAKEPTKQLAALNEQYGFVTAAIYEQVRSLEQQGDRQGAATIALNAYASAMNDKAQKIKANLGLIESAWATVTSAAKRGWDAILDVGRESSLDQKMANAQKSLDLLKQIGGTVSVPGLNRSFSGEDGKKQLQVIIDGYKSVNAQQVASAKAEGEKNRIQREGQVAFEEYQKGVEAGYSKTRQMNEELEKEQLRITKARDAGYKISAEEEEASYKRIRENSKYKEKEEKKPKAYTEDAGIKALDQAKQQYAVLQEQSGLIGAQAGEVQKLGASAQALIKWEQELADIKEKKTLTADQKSLLANQQLITAQLKRNAGLEKENALRKTASEEIEKLAAFQANQASQLSAAKDGLDSSIAGIGLGDRARSQLQQDLAIQKDYAKQSSDLLEQRNTGRISEDLYQKQNTVIQEGLASRLLMQQDYYNQEAVARDNWAAGSSEAWQNYLDVATDYSQQAQDATSQILGDTTSSLSDQLQGLATGAVSVGEAFANLGSTMANSVLKALADIAAQWVVVQALKMAGITAETTATVAAEGTKAAAKVTGDTIATGSTLAALATTVSANVAAAATTMASWLPAALVASVGSFGAAAIVGGAGLLAAFALIKGFSSGGYTGAGGVNDPAGIVHKGEVVWSQADIKRSGGVASVEAMRKGNVSPINASAKGRAAGGGTTAAPAAANGGTVVNLHEDASRAGQVQTSTGPDGKQITDMWVSNIRTQGQMAKTLEQTYGLRRIGR
jgi:lambda family phage tail tape measure protein